MEFFRDLFSGETFLVYPLIAGILGSLAFGVVGTYVVVRRISYIAGAVAHSVLGGIGAALFLKHKYGIEWLNPQLGALFAALLAILLIALAGWTGSQREDSLIGTVWVIGMSAGVLFMAATPGYNDLSGYLFGDILFISKSDLWLLAFMDIAVVVVCWLFYHKMLAVCFDEQFARLRGVNSSFYYFLLLLLTAITVVLMINIVGIVMVIALLTLPAAAASMFSRHLWQMMILSCIFCLISVVCGFSVSYSADMPTGAVIVVVCAVIYLLAVVTKSLRHTVRVSISKEKREKEVSYENE